MKRIEADIIIKKLTKRLDRMMETRAGKTGHAKCKYLSINPVELFVFGSYAKGSENPNDLDFILLYDEYDDFEEEYYWNADRRGYESNHTATKKIFKYVPNYHLLAYQLKGQILEHWMKDEYEKIFRIAPAKIDMNKIKAKIIKGGTQMEANVLPLTVGPFLPITEYEEIWSNPHDVI